MMKLCSEYGYFVYWDKKDDGPFYVAGFMDPVAAVQQLESDDGCMFAWTAKANLTGVKAVRMSTINLAWIESDNNVVPLLQR